MHFREYNYLEINIETIRGISFEEAILISKLVYNVLINAYK